MRTRPHLTASFAAAIFALTGCANNGPATTPSTWAIPAETLPAATLSTAHLITTTPAATGSTTVPSPAPEPAADPPGRTGSAQPDSETTNPTYDINQINRADPTQVAWAYLTSRLSNSYTDPTPGSGLANAAQYAAPDLAAQLDNSIQNTIAIWPAIQKNQASAIATLTHLSLYSSGDKATVIATWTLTVTAGDHAPHITSGLSTTLTLTSAAGEEWQVAIDGLAQPN